jgi:uncharacterized protein (DUF488 family)
MISTIGHSSHSIDRFLALLEKHGVTAVADVRSAPYSRFNPHFNRESLEGSLRQSGIQYVFLGVELGARTSDRTCYEKGRVQYMRLARTEAFRRGIERLMKGTKDHHIALVCAEKEPLDCHRTVLVARVLTELGVPVQHILADGRMEPHEASMDRLLALVGLPARDLFRSREELVAEALARQEERVAYVDEKLATAAVRETP